MADLLTHAGRPIAYSSRYCSKLYKFEAQYIQSTIHAIHTRWWIERLTNLRVLDNNVFADMILEKKQSDGLIYDVDVSETALRHRMKSELTMSAAMGIEILFESCRLTNIIRDELSASLCDPRKIPRLGYMVSEQFRLAALRILGREEQFPIGIGKYIEACADGLEYGWCDFSMASKVDAYMGTVKRTTRDKGIHSPLIACHVAVLLEKIDDLVNKDIVFNRLISYARYLANNPLDIPAFKMRDIQIPFGTDITPIEVICASYLIAKQGL
jgi:hypothetical protein